MHMNVLGFPLSGLPDYQQEQLGRSERKLVEYLAIRSHSEEQPGN